MISACEARSLVLALAHPMAAQTVPLIEAQGRVLAAPAVAQLTQPPFNAAAMDGYALRRSDAGSALQVIGESAAGHPWTGTAAPGTAIRIFTGAPVPDFYDCVAMQENVSRNGDIIRVDTHQDKPNIRPRGTDFSAGDTIAPGRLLTAADIGLLAAMNLPQVTVAARPRVAILAGGDELVRPGRTPEPGQIISSNDLAVAALARQAGAEAEILPIARDSEADLRDGLNRAAEADLVVTIGGASVGDHDLVGRVAADLGMERAFYKVALRPGKPLIAGRIRDAAMIGLPGNPVSAIVCAILFVQPLIRQMQGRADPGPFSQRARLAAPLPAEGNRQHYQRAKLQPGSDLPLINPFSDQDSGRLRLLADADALLIRPAHDAPREAGEIVDYLPLRGQD